jgi:hypothetical protein
MSEEHRRSLRKPANAVIEVTDTIAERVMGRIGNLSTDGLLMITPETLPSSALYLVSFPLPAAKGTKQAPGEVKRIALGIQEQWGEEAKVPGQYWTGFRIIDIAPEDAQRLAQWVGSEK